MGTLVTGLLQWIAIEKKSYYKITLEDGAEILKDAP